MSSSAWVGPNIFYYLMTHYTSPLISPNLTIVACHTLTHRGFRTSEVMAIGAEKIAEIYDKEERGKMMGI